MKITALSILALVAAFLLFGAIQPSNPEKSAARSAIDLCWQDYKTNSFDPSTQRFVAGMCEQMESAFTAKFGVKP